MIILTIGLIFPLLAGCVEKEASPTNECVEGEAIPQDKLKEDVEFLFESLEQIHPNPYGFTDKKHIYEMKRQLIQNLDEPTSSMEFYKAIAPIIVELKDGHTSMSPPIPPPVPEHPKKFNYSH